MVRTMRSATGNALLDTLPESARAVFRSEAQLVSFEYEQQVLAQGEDIRLLYFPVTAVCSLIVSLTSGQRVEIGTVGNEGFVGTPALLGRTRSPEFAIVQVAGDAYTIGLAQLKRFRDEYDKFGRALLDYIAYACEVAKQSTACNAFHSIDQRLARWLLTMHDRARRDQFRLRQELLAYMVSATRPRVSEAAGRLRAAGIIDYSQSMLRIKDRKRLEAAACECYAAMRPPQPPRKGAAPAHVKKQA